MPCAVAPAAEALSHASHALLQHADSPRAAVVELGGWLRAHSVGASEGGVDRALHFPPLADAISALRPDETLTDGSASDRFSPVRTLVRAAQRLMFDSGGEATQSQLDALPLGGTVEFLQEPVGFVENAVQADREVLAAAARLPEKQWGDVVGAVSTDSVFFLAAVVAVTPAFRALKQSPVLGFLLSGLLLSRAGLFVDNEEVDQLCELGIQFLLFEMGLELSLTRLQSLAKYAFGLGLAQVVLTNAGLTAALLPVGDALGTRVLDFVQPGHDDLLQIGSVLEALVVGFGLTLSSSAFALQLLADKEMMSSRFGTAALGMLLFQDVAVVPFIVLLPVLRDAIAGGGDVNFEVLAAGGATSFLDLGVLAIVGRQVAVSLYKLVKKTRAGDDVFVALSLLVLAVFSGAAQSIGFSSSLGAFLGGIVLADTPYGHEIIDRITPFKSLFLSLFFVTVGTTVDVELLTDLWPIALVMSGTLVLTKIGVVTAAGRLVGLTWQEGLVAGSAIAQGGEFAFVIFAQASANTGAGANSVLPPGLSKLLVGVIILSMALTPVVMELALKISGGQEAVAALGDTAMGDTEGGDSDAEIEVNARATAAAFPKNPAAAEEDVLAIARAMGGDDEVDSEAEDSSDDDDSDSEGGFRGVADGADVVLLGMEAEGAEAATTEPVNVSSKL